MAVVKAAAAGLRYCIAFDEDDEIRDDVLADEMRREPQASPARILPGSCHESCLSPVLSLPESCLNPVTNRASPTVPLRTPPEARGLP